MCPDLEVTKEEEEAILKEAEAEEVSEEVRDLLTPDEVAEANHLDAEAEFEGVDKVEDIPKGKEKNYGI